MPKDATDVLAKLPKSTPAWAVGLAAIFVSASVAAATFYLIAKDDISKVVAQSFESDQKRTDADLVIKTKLEDNNASTIGQILALARSNGEAITRLAEDNGSLKARVSALEDDLRESKKALEVCEMSLKVCKKGT